MNEIQILSTVNAAIGLLFIGLGVPLMQRRIKMNRWYGVRFKAAFQSEEDWYAINEYGGRWLVGLGVLLIAVGIAGLVYPPSEKYGLWLALAPMVALVMCIPCYRFSRARMRPGR